MKKHNAYVVIMAGGGGTRFWPWSREKQPKQILPIFSRKTMIWETVNRIRPLTSWKKIFIVTSRLQAEQIHQAVPQIPPKNLLLEPVGRNTAPCLCLAAMHIQKIDPHAVMIALPADHFIRHKKGFLRTLERAAEYAAREDYLITLGIQPTTPETGYGYIQRGILLGKVRGTKVFEAKAFREKPTLEKAKAYLRQGDYLWNSGMFIWKVRVFLEAVEKFLPQLHRDMLGIKDSLGKRGEKRALESIYDQCQSISVDYGIMEKAPHVAVIQASFHWDDIGSWSALWNLWPKDRNGNAYIQGKPTKDGRILAIDSTGCMIRGEKNLIAVLGLKNMAVVEAGDAFLVCPLERSQDVRRILQQLRTKGWNEYL